MTPTEDVERIRKNVGNGAYGNIERDEMQILLALLDRANAVVQALIGTDICYNHFQDCRYTYRQCTCGHDEIVRALKDYDAAEGGVPKIQCNIPDVSGHD